RSQAAAARATAHSRATLEAKVVTATRAGATRMSSARQAATSVSEGERPSRNALVESPISARQPSLPSARSLASSVAAPTSGVGSIFQSPVWSTVPAGVRMMSPFDSGQRVVGKSNAEIDRNPLPAMLVAEAVNREIHADLAGPAKRREHEISGGVHGREFRSRRLGGDGRGFQEHVPRCDGPIAAVGQSQHQAAGLVQGFETTN